MSEGARYMIIIGTFEGRSERHTFKFSAGNYDSSALRDALCITDPGREFTVWFTDELPESARPADFHHVL